MLLQVVLVFVLESCLKNLLLVTLTFPWSLWPVLLDLLEMAGQVPNHPVISSLAMLIGHQVRCCAFGPMEVNFRCQVLKWKLPAITRPSFGIQAAEAKYYCNYFPQDTVNCRDTLWCRVILHGACICGYTILPFWISINYQILGSTVWSH